MLRPYPYPDPNPNPHPNQARALLLLCGVLLGIGYSPSRLTILSAYVGQLLLLRSCLDSAGGAMGEIELSTVDAYQGEENDSQPQPQPQLLSTRRPYPPGEENDIVLLSLVRSNEQGKLGFTAVDNRVCVALSRARLGFFCACNLSMLGDGSELWNKVRKYLRDERRSGGALPLKAPQTAAAIPQYLREEDGGREAGELAAPLDPEAGGLGDPGGMEAGWRAAWEHGLEGLRLLASGTVATAAAGVAPRLAPCERTLPCGHQCSRLCHLLEESSSVQCMCERCLPSDEVREAETRRWRALQSVLSLQSLFGAAATTDAPDVVSPNPRVRREGQLTSGGAAAWSTIVEPRAELAGEARTAAAWAAAEMLVGHGSDGRYGEERGAHGGGGGAPAPAPAPAPASSRLRAGAGAKPGAVADASRGSIEAAGTIAPQPTRAPYPTKTFLTSTTGSSPPRARPAMRFGGANPQGADVRASSGFAITTAATAPVGRPASPPPPRQHKQRQRTSRSPSPQPVPLPGSKPKGRHESRRKAGGGAAGSGAAGGGAAEAPLPEGWEVRMSDRAGRSFFFHRATKTKTWHHAEMLATVRMHAAREATVPTLGYSPSPPRAAHRSRRRDPSALPEAEAKASGKRHKRSRGEGERRGSGKAKSSPPGFTY